jgi:hypothetical protein
MAMEINQHIPQQMYALLGLNLTVPNGNLITKSLSKVMKQRKKTLASDEIVDRIPAVIHQLLFLQYSSTKLYLKIIILFSFRSELFILFAIMRYILKCQLIISLFISYLCISLSEIIRNNDIISFDELRKIDANICYFKIH